MGDSAEPVFHRGQVARILGVTPLTMANREASKKYPEPKRDLNNYRIYTINDVLNLQLLTYRQIDPRPIAEVLFDMGWTDPRRVGQLLDRALARRTAS
jgi:hypothetical protein